MKTIEYRRFSNYELEILILNQHRTIKNWNVNLSNKVDDSTSIKLFQDFISLKISEICIHRHCITVYFHFLAGKRNTKFVCFA